MRLGTSGDRRCGHQVGRRHSVLCFSPHDACTAVCFKKLPGMYLDRQRYTVFWPYTICRPNTKTKINRTSGQTHRLSVIFFLHVAIRNSLRSNKKNNRNKFVPERNIWTPPTLRSTERGSVNSCGYLANHHCRRARHGKGCLPRHISTGSATRSVPTTTNFAILHGLECK